MNIEEPFTILDSVTVNPTARAALWF
jgi:hypothetical protein